VRGRKILFSGCPFATAKILSEGKRAAGEDLRDGIRTLPSHGHCAFTEAAAPASLFTESLQRM
jgi:hypothetical protein